MHADRQDRLVQLFGGAVVEVDELAEALGLAADDGQHQRQAVLHGAHHRFRTAADADPGLQPAALDRRIDGLVLQFRPHRALPGDGLLLQDFGEQVELLGEQPLVVLEREAEEREGFREGAAADDDFGAAIGNGVERRKTLEDADWVVRAQHGDGRAETDAAGLGGDACQHHFGRRDSEVVAVMLADADEVDAHLVGQHAFGDHVAQHLRLGLQFALEVDGDVAEGIEAEFELFRHGLFRRLLERSRPEHK